ncbi:MAG: hypothetical protein CVU39_22125 [Chloroflexi bacterium HGW-Chloroflexi-10]|nr:MAG: hypothetical protein CVU39_22125 [Chloroflexi bacterium HGW-Chloroflexi-10]
MTNKAGKSTREMAEERQKKSRSYLLIGFGIAICLFLISLNPKAMGTLGGGGVLLLLIASRVIPDIVIGKSNKKIKEAKRADRGAVAEEKIGAMLENLGEDFLPIHDVVSQFGNIDHVLIGKECGMILIETKAHGGKIRIDNGVLLVNGKLPEKDFIKQTLNNTYWLRDRIEKELGIKPWIHSVIVFTNAFVSAPQPIKGISVINKKFLTKFIEQNKKPVLTNEMIWEKREEIVDLLTPKI